MKPLAAWLILIVPVVIWIALALFVNLAHGRLSHDVYHEFHVVLPAFGPKGKALMIYESDGRTIVTGDLEYEVEPMTGHLTPQFCAKDNLFLSRKTGQFADRLPVKAGSIYTVSDQCELREIGAFDKKLTDEEIENEYLE